MSMSAETAITYVINNEGGYVDHPNDRGGPTKYGISLKFLDNLYNKGLFPLKPTRETIRNLDMRTAIDLYKKHFWDFYKIGLIKDVRISTKVLDCIVMSSPLIIIRNFQKAVNFSSPKGEVAIDGLMGNQTADAANQADAKLLLRNFQILMGRYYQKIAEHDPSQKVFLKGWLNRVWEFPDGLDSGKT